MAAGFGYEFDGVTRERGDDPVPYFTAHVPMAPFFGDVQLATDLEAMHGSHGDVGGLGELGDSELG
jgi:hypothetical protein